MKGISFQSIIILATAVFIFSLQACTKDSTEDPMVTPPNTVTGEIWRGGSVTFTNSDNVDETLEANQDRITDNVWITRSPDGGQIFNIKVESDSDKSASPTGTKWAIGNISNVANLNFRNFRATIKPQDVVGEDLVMWLEEDDIYISVRFTSWSSGKKGGFSYERSIR